VEYVVAGKEFRARALVLGGGGILLRAHHNISLGETLTVVFRTGKRAPKVEARAIVRSRSSADGIGLEFTSMRPTDHQKILRFIHAQMDEKREDPRAPFVAQVHSQNSTFLGLSKNISVGGIFIETRESLPIGCDLELRFHLDDGDPVIIAKGEVVYVVDKLGLGVQFRGLDATDQKRIEQYVGKGIIEVAESESVVTT